MDKNALSNLNITDGKWLNEITQRDKCDKCKKSRKYFCYICHLPVCGKEKIPEVKLPVKIDIIKHETEYHGKSTSGHAKILAKNDVEIYKYPTIPDYNPEETLLLFPGDDSKPLKEYEKLDLTKFKTVVLIDCTWNQTSAIGADERLKELPKIQLNEYVTKFWRHKGENRPDTYLSTIEATYYLCVEWDSIIHPTEDTHYKYDGRYDDLLFYFKYIYDKLYNITNGGSTIKAYQSH